MPPVDVDREIARGQSRKRPVHASLKFVVRCAHADRFANGERDEFAHAERGGQRKGRRAARGDCMEIERNPHANHNDFFLR